MTFLETLAELNTIHHTITAQSYTEGYEIGCRDTEEEYILRIKELNYIIRQLEEEKARREAIWK